MVRELKGVRERMPVTMSGLNGPLDCWTSVNVQSVLEGGTWWFFSFFVFVTIVRLMSYGLWLMALAGIMLMTLELIMKCEWAGLLTGAATISRRPLRIQLQWKFLQSETREIHKHTKKYDERGREKLNTPHSYLRPVHMYLTCICICICVCKCICICILMYSNWTCISVAHW